MANEIYNSSYWGNGVCDNTIDWGVVYKDFAGCTPSFSNTYSLAFDGVDDKIQFESIALGSDYTLSAWAKRLSTANMFLFGNSQTYGYGAYFNGTSNLYFKETNSDLITFNNTAIQTALARTDWVNWVFKKDSTAGTVSVYVDGVLAESTSSVKGMSTITTIGGSGLSSGTQYIWNGNIDEVAIFNTSSVSLDDLGSSTTPKDLSSISGLIAWYRNGDNGSYKSPQWLIPNNSNKDKVSNYSLQLDGVDDYMTVSTPTTLTDFTTSVWLHRTGNGNFDGIFGQDNTTAKGGILRYVSLDGTNITLFLTSGWTAMSGALAINTWHHFALTYDSTANELKSYINGSLYTTISSPDFSGQSTDAHSFNRIGMRNGTTATSFPGLLDEIALWNTAKSATDITAIYNGGEPTTITGATAYYKMGEEANFTDNWLVNNSALSNYSTRSFNFDGVDDYIQLGSGVSFAGEFTLSIWVKPNGFSTSQVIVGNGSSSNNWIRLSSASSITFKIGATSLSFADVGNNLVDGVWQHLLFYRDSSNNVGIFRNGSAFSTTQSNSNTLELSTFAKRGTLEYTGSIDEVAFWNANKSSDVATIYSSGTPADINSLSPLSWYRMGEDATFSTNWSLPDNGSASNTSTSANMTIADLEGEAPNYTGGGLSANMTIEDRVGDASMSSNNAVSFNQVEADRETDVPT